MLKANSRVHAELYTPVHAHHECELYVRELTGKLLKVGGAASWD